MRHPIPSASALAALALLAAVARPATAQRPAGGAARAARSAAADSGAFLVRLGNDTVAAERFVRAGDRVEGDLFNRTGAAPRVTHYVVTLDAAGRPTRAELRTRRPDGSAVPNAALGTTITYRNDSAFAEVQLPDSTARFRMAVPAGTVPALPNSYGMWEIAMRALRAAGRDSGAVSLWGPGAPQAAALPVRLVGADSAAVVYFGDPVRLRVDRAARILAVDGMATTNKVRAERVASLDVAALARTLAARPIAQPSPRDTVRATVGAAQVLVDYSRPSVRGRTVWGGALVPYGQVWRTGANAATQLVTSADLTIGGAAVPAGTYTLFTLPTADGGQLIVSKKTGEWGTEYEAAQDLVRVPLRASALATPVEQFTIAVEPVNGTPSLVLRWADRQLAAPIAAR